MYDFDKVPERRPFNSEKWSYLGRECPSRGEDLIPLWVADMDFPSPPEVVAALRARAEHTIYGYAGLPESFFEAFVEWMKRRQGVEVPREWLLFCPGVVPGIALAIRAFTSPGDGILIQPPVYHPFARLIAKSGRRVVENPLRLTNGRYEMDFDQLEAALDGSVKMVILCSPHNPVGRVWEKTELERFAALVERSGALLVSDEIHSDIVFAPHRHATALTSGVASGGTRGETWGGAIADSLLVFNAPSKTFNLAGLQTSYVAIPNAHLRAKFEAEEESFALASPNAFGIQAAEAAYRHGEAWLEALLTYLGGNYRFLAERVGTRLHGLRLMPLEGTYLAWLDFSDSSVPDLRRRGFLHEFLMKEAGIWCDEGSKFGTGGEGFVRVNLACPRSRLSEALDRLEAALGGVRAV